MLVERIGRILVCSIALLALPREAAGASISAPSLFPVDPYSVYADTLPRLYTIQGISIRFYPSVSNGLMSWRAYIGP
ncbi:MAG TPA: hypothetical protein P5266_02220, partial [Candidatus Fermentibacter sp.]|nr:hypothetical protein [Candidatus Fermentibacter sp.]